MLAVARVEAILHSNVEDTAEAARTQVLELRELPILEAVLVETGTSRQQAKAVLES